MYMYMVYLRIKCNVPRHETEHTKKIISGAYFYLTFIKTTPQPESMYFLTSVTTEHLRTLKEMALDST
jgi:hypothetical protein